MQAGAVEALGTLEIDEMGNAIVSISIKGKTLSQTEITNKELEILKLWFIANDNK